MFDSKIPLLVINEQTAKEFLDNFEERLKGYFNRQKTLSIDECTVKVFDINSNAARELGVCIKPKEIYFEGFVNIYFDKTLYSANFIFSFKLRDQGHENLCLMLFKNVKPNFEGNIFDRFQKRLLDGEERFLQECLLDLVL